MESKNTPSEGSPVSKEEVQALISTLPKGNGWLSSNDIYLRQYQGFWYHPHVIEKILKGIDPPSSSHRTLLCTIPKSGTTWLKALAFAIATRNRYLHMEDSPVLSTFSQHLIPYIEFPTINHAATGDHDLPLLSTHLPYTSLPNSVSECGMKIVYLCRDPKDAFISYWHFGHQVRPNKDSTEPIPLDQALDLFCHGVSPFGPYWDHVLQYWKAKLDNPDKVLFLKYEDMMSDPILYVNRLAEFMGYPFSNDEVTEGVDVKIMQTCSFESLSNINVNTKVQSEVVSSNIFFRKGKVGDWKNYLTQEMADRIDQISATKLSPFGLVL